MNYIQTLDLRNIHWIKLTFSKYLLLNAVWTGLVLIMGCSTDKHASSIDQFYNFNRLDYSAHVIQTDKLVPAPISDDMHSVVPGEVIELTMPAVLSVVSAQENVQVNDISPLLCRVSPEGTIALPVVEDVDVAGLTLPQIEALVINAYYLKYTKSRPTVFARLVEEKTYRVSIAGAVNSPGVYDLRYDEMSVLALLKRAGGIVSEGASGLRIVRTKNTQKTISRQSRVIPRNVHGDMSQRRSSLITATSTSTPVGLARSAAWEPEISFLPYNNSLRGRLIVKRNGRQFQRELDLASTSQRLNVLSDLSEFDQNLDISVLQAHLQQLAVQLESSGNPIDRRKERFKLDHTVTSPKESDIMLVDYQQIPSTGIRSGTEEQDEQQGSDDPSQTTTIQLPIESGNVPFVDLGLKHGDRVIVDQLQTAIFTVMGLVRSPGNFEYPSGAEYNLMETIGFAGGIDPALEPHYAVIYRMKPDGDIVSLTVDIQKPVAKSGFTSAMLTPVKPGDIVMLEHTRRTRTKKVINELFSIRVGAYVPILD